MVLITCVLIAGVVWITLTLRRPLISFGILLAGFLVLYSRLAFRISDGAGPGSIYLMDVLWLLTMSGLVYRCFKLIMASRLRLPLAAWGIAPYVVMATILPLLGVVFYGFPLSYSVLGLRVIQWVSFGVMSYFLAKRFAREYVARVVTVAIIVSGLLHLGYACVQFLYSVGLVGPAWVGFDRFVEAQGISSWFYYPRLTGFLVNPNTFGLFGAMLFVVSTAIYLAKMKLSKGIWTLLVLAGLFSIVFSGSRSALLGLLCGIGVLWVMMVGVGSGLTRLAKWAFVITMVLSIQLAGIISIIPERQLERFLSFLNVVPLGVEADANFLGRVQLWDMHIDNYLRNYPFGTLVSPQYVLGSAVDSYYVNALVQGTPAFLITFILFIVCGGVLGFLALKYATTTYEKAFGLIFSGWIGVLAGGSISLGPPEHVYFMASLWTVGGICLRTILARFDPIGKAGQTG